MHHLERLVELLGDEVLQQEAKVAEVIQGLYEAGVAAGGVVIMDVGINRYGSDMPAWKGHNRGIN